MNSKQQLVSRYIKLAIKTGSIMAMGALATIVLTKTDAVARGVAIFGVVIEIASVIVVMLRGVKAMKADSVVLRSREKSSLSPTRAVRRTAIAMGALVMFGITGRVLSSDGVPIVFSGMEKVLYSAMLAVSGIAAFHWMLSLDVEDESQNGE